MGLLIPAPKERPHCHRVPSERSASTVAPPATTWVQYVPAAAVGGVMTNPGVGVGSAVPKFIVLPNPPEKLLPELQSEPSGFSSNVKYSPAAMLPTETDAGWTDWDLPGREAHVSRSTTTVNRQYQSVRRRLVFMCQGF